MSRKFEWLPRTSFCRALLIGVLITSLGAGCTFGIGLKKDNTPIETRGAEPMRTPIYEHAGWTIARASFHNHTIYSDGCRTPEDLLELARMQGMAVLSYNDHREGEICAGKNGLVCARVGGIENYGYAEYFGHLGKIQKTAAEQNMIVLKGIEVIPYFYNYGKSPNIVLDGLQHHFTVYNIEDESIFEEMPVRGMVTLKPEQKPDAKPWADFVDYITEKGGIVHAVHVEAGEDRWYGPAHGACPPVPNNIHDLKNLTGFSVLPDAFRAEAGSPGGRWDTVLVEYLYGMRKKPLWTMGDADYHCSGSLAIATTLLYMEEFTEEEVYRCMREGRMVALQGESFQDTYVTEWSIGDGSQAKDPIMHGEEVYLSRAPLISFSLNKPVDGCRTRLVRNGVVIKEVEGTTLSFTDRELAGREEPAFYRIEITGPVIEGEPYKSITMPESKLFTNPIFVRFK